MFILTLLLSACEKDKDNDTSDPTLNYRLTQQTSKMNGEYWDRITYAYESEKLILMEDYDFEFENSELDEKSMFEYPDENTIIREDYDMKESTPESQYRWVCSVDEDRITEIVYYYKFKDLFNDTEEWLQLTRYLFIYIGNQLSEKKFYLDVDGLWEINSRTTYDSESGKVAEVKSYEYDSTGVEKLTYDYQLEYEGDKVSQILTNYLTNPKYKRILEYNGNKVISAVTYEWISGTWESWYEDQYEYDSEGNCIRIKEFYFETSDEYIDDYTYEKGKSNYWLLMNWPGSERYY